MRVTVDAVVFAYINKELKVLLIRRALEPFKHKWALAGGFVNENETTEQAVLRKLKEETNVDVGYLEQLYTFSEVDRDPRERIISIAYYGLINPSNFELITNVHAEEVTWHQAIAASRKILAFDHNEILKYAITRLRNKIKYEPIGFELLPEVFTMPELLGLYNAITNEELDRRNFQRKILKTKILKEVNMVDSIKRIGKPPKYYMFDIQKYNKFKKSGFNFEL